MPSEKGFKSAIVAIPPSRPHTQSKTNSRLHKTF